MGPVGNVAVVRPPRSPEELRAVHAYDGCPRGDRVHVRLRWWTCPFPAVEREVPWQGRILEVGCGHGVLSLHLAASSRARQVVGVDVDADKIDLARRAATVAGLADRVSFVAMPLADLDDSGFDAVVIADVLYLLPPDARRALLVDGAGRLAPGGRIVAKEADRRPRWKGALTVAQELISTRVLRITEGEQVAFTPPGELARPLRDAGLDVVIRRVDRGYLHPHVLLVATAPGGTVPG